MIIAISLVWIRHKVAGGVESFTRNILDGLSNDKSNNKYYLLCSKDNIESFREYSCDCRFSVIECPVTTTNLVQTLFFESFKLDNLVTELKADLCFVPSFRMPLFEKNNKYVSVIHDLISDNMPQMFKWYRRVWLNWATKRAWNRADYVVTISDFVSTDLARRFGGRKNRGTIYNPILPSKDTIDFDILKQKYKISKGCYFYTVSSLASNKNLFTILKMMKALCEDGLFDDFKLLVSGVGLSKNAKNRFDVEPYLRYLEDNRLTERCIFTGFVSNEERNTLITHCNTFLFPSVFEGFGMPVIEAMELGAKVITTKCASIPEVSHNKAIYVNNPYDEIEWYKTLRTHLDESVNPIHFSEYELEVVTNNYLKVFNSVIES